MKTNLFRRMRGVACAALLALGATTAFAATETVTFIDQTGTGTAGSSWQITAAAASDASGVLVECAGTAYINGTIPYGTKDWRITSITINGVSNVSGITVTCAVNGVGYTASGYTFTGSTLGESVAGIKLSGTGDFQFTNITIEYEEVSVPQLTWIGSDGLTSTSTIVLDFSEPMYINGTTIDAATLALVASAITLTAGDDNDVTKTVVVNSSTRITITTTGVKNCYLYGVQVSSLIVNSAGVQVYKNHRSEAYLSHEEVIKATGKGLTSTLYAGETFTPATDLTVMMDGTTDITSECTFSNINTASAGDKTLTITHGNCTQSVTITVTARPKCTITWTNEVTGETLAATEVSQGIAIGNTLSDLPKPSVLTVKTDCGEKTFKGWTTSAISGSTDDAPSMITLSSVPQQATYTVYAVYADVTDVVANGWVLVTNASELTGWVGKELLFANSGGQYVLGKANTNNFAAAKATFTDGVLVPDGTGFTSVVLGGSAGAWTFKTDAGYLYAASSTKNYLKTQATNDANGQWKVTIATDGAATVTAQGTNTRKKLQYNPNNNSPLFSCYEENNNTQKPVYIYRNASTSTGYITKCSCTALGQPTGLSTPTDGLAATSAQASWTAVTGATSYTVYYSTDQTAWTEAATVETNSASITGLTKNTKYYWKVVAHADGKTYCVDSPESTVAEFTSASNCTYQIQMGVNGGTWTSDCLTQVGTSTEWQYQITLPAGDLLFWIGDSHGFVNGHSATWNFSRLTFAALQPNNCTSQPYPGEGSVGTLRIYSDYTDENYYVAFLPTYQIAYGVEGSTWQHLPFEFVTGNTYETALTEIPADYKTSKFYVGPKKADGGTNWVNGKSVTVGMTTMGGLNGSNDMAGVKGKFYIYDNSCDNNWYCAFVPYYNIVYYNADNTTVFKTSDYVASNAPTDNKKIKILTEYPQKTGYRFVGWSHTPNATTADLTAGADYALGKPNEALYPVYVQQATLKYDGNGGTNTCEATTADVGTAVDICTDDPTRDGYHFDGWSTTQDESGLVGSTITLNENTTLYALWTKYLTVTYVTTNLTLAGGCTAVTSNVYPGTSITLCGAPTSTLGYTFLGWLVDDETSVRAAGTTVTVNSDMTIAAKWDVPDITFTFTNEGAGSENVKTEKQTVPQDTYVTAPTSVTVPTNCEGKVFIGWTNTTITDETKYQDTESLVAAGFKFLSPGEKMLADKSETVAPRTWYAVFAKTE